MRHLVLPALALLLPALILWSLRQPPREVSLEWELSVVNAGGEVASDHPLLAQFHRLLNRLEEKCSNSRREIVEVCIAAHYFRKERGHLGTLLELTREIDGAIPPGLDQKVDIREIVRPMLPP